MFSKQFSEEPIFIQKIEETEKYQLSKQTFSYICKNCGQLYTRNLYMYLKIHKYTQLFCKKCLTEISKQRRQKTCIEKYGVDNIRKSEKYKEHCKQLYLEKYGVENISQAKEIKKKKEQTYLEHFGVKNPKQSKEVKEKTRQTWLSKTSEEIRDIRRKASKKYTYQDEQFDSSWELAFYIYCKDHNKNILRETKSFSFMYNNKIHYFIPDFEVDEKLYEIKGDQFLAKDNTWKDPFNTHLDNLYEAKHQCAIKNNVILLYSKDCQKYLDYVTEKYGKNYLQYFRNT